MQHELVVRNTFIEVGADDDEDDEPLDRSQSDPTGGRLKTVTPLMKISEIKVPPPIQEADERTDSGFDTGDPSTLCRTMTGDSSVCSGCGNVFGSEDFIDCSKCGRKRPDEFACHDDDDDNEPMCTAMTQSLWPEDDEEDDDDEPLQRSGAPRAKPGETVSLSSLVPEDSSRDPAGPPAYVGASGMPGLGGMMWPYMMPPAMFDPSMMYTMMQPKGKGKGKSADGYEASASSAYRPQVPALGTAPALGFTHCFHQETRNMGTITPDFRQFTKVGYEGRLSVVSESVVHDEGKQRYLVQFAGGELSRADGVGFVFSPRLPCAKNIQRIVSIFVNQRGRICMRVFADIIRASAFIKPLEIGDWVEMSIDLENKVATFNVWPPSPNGWPLMGVQPSSTAEFPYGNRLGKLNQAGAKPVNLTTGHLACVVKNVGVTIILGS